MSKNPRFNLAELTAGAAMPMQDGVQREVKPAPPVVVALPESALPAAPASAAKMPAQRHARPSRAKVAPEAERVPVDQLESLSFKVSPSFNRRFRDAAYHSKLKLNDLLFQAFAEWEKQHKS